MYYSKEEMQQHDDEAQLVAATPAVVEAQPVVPVVSNWRYFIHGHNVYGNEDQNRNLNRDQSADQNRDQNQNAMEMQPTQPQSQSRWQRFRPG